MDIKVNISSYQLLQSIYENSSATDLDNFIKIISRVVFKTYFINSEIKDESLNDMIDSLILKNEHFNDIFENEIY